MPFKSKSQQRWMYANEPEMAKKWSDHTPDHDALPEKAKKKEKRMKTTEKIAAAVALAKVREKCADQKPFKRWGDLATTLGGAAIGGGLGGLADYLTYDEEAGRDSPWEGALTGAVLGGGLGWGLNPLINRLRMGAKAEELGDYEASDFPSSEEWDDESLADILPEGYREDAQRLAQEYRDKDPLGSGSTDFVQDISDKSIDRKVPSQHLDYDDFGRLLGGDPGGAGAFYNSLEDQISYPAWDEDMAEYTKGHELTHAGQGYDHRRFGGQRPAGYRDDVAKVLGEDTSWGGGSTELTDYLTRPQEEEAFLAEIKRKYFDGTGKQVTDSADAEEAIDWYLDQVEKGYPDVPDAEWFQPGEGGLLEAKLYGGLNAMEPSATGGGGKWKIDDDGNFNYDPSPAFSPTKPDQDVRDAAERWKKYLMEKMPGLVRTGRPELHGKTASEKAAAVALSSVRQLARRGSL
jgi:hypothetical protein